MHLRDGLITHATLRQRYDHFAQGGALQRDPAQARVVAALDHLLDRLAAKRLARKSSSLGWLFGRKPESRDVKGLYIHGGVGRGKTMLMDMFFDMVPMRRKRRAHFNDFMADVHDRIQKHREARKIGTVREDDPIPPVARSIAEEAQLLCFDEFTVTDIADAMVMSRLFTALFANGVVLVATSNVAPDDLYRDGLNRALFLPFIEILKRHAEIICLDADTDYRMEKLTGLPVYITPLGADADRQIEEAWTAMTRGGCCAPATIQLKGREISVPLACEDAARFSFADLCEEPLGARDYLAITDRYSTVFVENVPALADGRRNEAKRLILLVDTLYDRHVRLVMSAAAPPSELYAGRSGVETFEFERTASRLTEMQSQDWLRDWAARHGDAAQARPRQFAAGEEA